MFLGQEAYRACNFVVKPIQVQLKGGQDIEAFSKAQSIKSC